MSTAVQSTRFVDQPDEFRLRIRDIVNAHGGNLEMYTDAGIQVALPREGWIALESELEAAGLREWRGSQVYFPNANHYPPSLRWDGPHPGSAGYICLVMYVLKDWPHR